MSQYFTLPVLNKTLFSVCCFQIMVLSKRELADLAIYRFGNHCLTVFIITNYCTVIHHNLFFI